MRERYESLALADLKAIAKARGLKGTSTMKKSDLVELMLAEDEKDKAAGKSILPGQPAALKAPEKRTEEAKAESPRPEGTGKKQGGCKAEGRSKEPGRGESG